MDYNWLQNHESSERFIGESEFYFFFSDTQYPDDYIASLPFAIQHTAMRINERKQKYKKELFSVIKNYEKWMNDKFIIIPQKKITHQLKQYLINLCHEKQYDNFDKALYGFSALLEFGNFCIYYMNKLLSDSVNAAIDTNLIKRKKAYEIEKSWLIYDFFRTIVKTKIIIKNRPKIKYKNNNDEVLDNKRIITELNSLTQPDDLRAIRLMFETERLGVKKDGFGFGVQWCRDYIDAITVSVFGSTRFLGEMLFSLNNEPIPAYLVLDRLMDSLYRLMNGYFFTNEKQFDKKYIIDCNNRVLFIKTKDRNAEGQKYIDAFSKIVVVIDLLYTQLKYIRNKDYSVDCISEKQVDEYINALFDLRTQMISITFVSSRLAENEFQKYDIENIEKQEKNISQMLFLCEIFRDVAESFDYSGELTKLMKQSLNIKQSLLNMEDIPDPVFKSIEETVSYIINRIKSSVALKENTEEKYSKHIIALLQSNEIIKKYYIEGKLKDFIITLSSAELLYNKYLFNESDNNLDYSFIAIMYYASLENLLNVCFYYPIKKHFENGYVNINAFKQYFDESSFNFFTHGETNYKRINKSLELGKIAKVFKYDYIGNKDNLPSELIIFLENNLKIDFKRINTFANHLSSATIERNSAAHCTKIVTYNDAKKTKTNTYYFDNKSVEKYKGIIVEFISLLGSK